METITKQISVFRRFLWMPKCQKIYIKYNVFMNKIVRYHSLSLSFFSSSNKSSIIILDQLNWIEILKSIKDNPSKNSLKSMKNLKIIKIICIIIIII